MKKIKITVSRCDPSLNKAQHYETYEVPADKKMWILDVLIYIREHYDSSLAFKYSCRHPKKCGSCGVLINGEPSLACMTLAMDGMVVEPLPFFPLIRDLAVDTTAFERNMVVHKAFLQRAVEPQKVPEFFASDKSFQQKTLFDLSSCIECYLCVSACPIAKKWTIGPVGHTTLARYAIDPRDKGDRPRTAYTQGLYYCSTCGRCKDVCPQEIAIPDTVIERLRSLSLEEGCVPPQIRDALGGVIKNGNPWNLGRSKRSDWAKGLKLNYTSEDERTELLYFVGCAACYDSRAQQIARSLVRNLNCLRIDFSILGTEETCCGNEVLGLGEEGLFEVLMNSNSGLFERYGINRIITTSPHCFNAFKNRYGRRKFEVQHYTQYFAELIDKGIVKYSDRLNKTVTYHDPCYLGRRNNIYDEPRKIIESIPGVEFLELNTSKERSLCCEGGGGRMWYDIPGQRLAELRIEEAIDIGAEILAVACPFCFLMLDDAVKTAGHEKRLKVKDIMELVSETL